jgi:hypothetical protein
MAISEIRSKQPSIWIALLMSLEVSDLQIRKLS